MLEEAPRISGQGVVVARAEAGISRLSRAFAASPLKLLFPKHHGTEARVTTTTYGGGLVDGDHLALSVEVGPNATLVLATQASTKAYRALRGTSQHLKAEIRDGALLVNVPEPLVCFEDARHEESVSVELSPEGSLIQATILTAGRVARGERWSFARFQSRTTLRSAGDPWMVEATRLDRAHGPIAERMRAFDALGTAIAVGPRAEATARRFLRERPAPRATDRVFVAASPLRGGAILRAAAIDIEALRQAFAEELASFTDEPAT